MPFHSGWRGTPQTSQDALSGDLHRACLFAHGLRCGLPRSGFSDPTFGLWGHSRARKRHTLPPEPSAPTALELALQQLGERVFGKPRVGSDGARRGSEAHARASGCAAQQPSQPMTRARCGEAERALSSVLRRGIRPQPQPCADVPTRSRRGPSEPGGQRPQWGRELRQCRRYTLEAGCRMDHIQGGRDTRLL